MTGPIIYKDSPLGEYLEGILPLGFWLLFNFFADGMCAGTGTCEADWGLSSETDAFDERDNAVMDDEVRRDFAPPSRLLNRKFNARELRPLIILNENIPWFAKRYNLFAVFVSAIPHN